MIPFEILVTAVSERADLFAESMDSLLANLDQQPSRILVHEDVRPGTQHGGIRAWLDRCGIPYAHKVTDPPAGMGPGILWLFREAQTPIPLYTQEDWLAVRPIPAARCLELMEEHSLHHIRFNKRKTMRAKHEDRGYPDRWDKVEVQVGGQTLCVSDHWYTQASFWRRDVALVGIEDVAIAVPGGYQFVHAFNTKMDALHGDGREWRNQAMRHELLRTYIWGPVGEPAFIRHLGSARTTGLVDHLAGRRLAP